MTKAKDNERMSLDMIFDEFPQLETRFYWDKSLVKDFITSGLLLGYIDSSREPVVIRKSLIYVLEHIKKVNQMREIDLNNYPEKQNS